MKKVSLTAFLIVGSVPTYWKSKLRSW